MEQGIKYKSDISILFDETDGAINAGQGVVASPFKTAYVAYKHALIGLTKSAALEYAGIPKDFHNHKNYLPILSPFVNRNISRLIVERM